MSGLIKHHRVRHVAVPLPPAPEDPHHETVAALEAQVHALTVQRDDERANASEREREAHARGVKEGRDLEARERDAHHQALMKALEASAHRAHELFESELRVAAEQLALALTHTGLERVLGDASRYRELVTQTVSHQLDSIAAHSVVSISVSAQDFAAQTSLELESALADTKVQLLRNPQLRPGSCVIKLHVGEVDASIPTQWQKLLDRLTQVDGRA